MAKATKGSGHTLLALPTVAELAPAEHKMIERPLGMPAQQFNTLLAEKIAVLEDKLVDSLFEDVANNKLTTYEKIFGFLGLEDKRRMLQGGAAIHNATVNVTVNNIGTREGIFEALGLQTSTSHGAPIEAQIVPDAPPQVAPGEIG